MATIPDAAQTEAVTDDTFIASGYRMAPAFVIGIDEDGKERLAPGAHLQFRGSRKGDQETEVELSVAVSPLDIPGLMAEMARALSSYGSKHMLDFAESNGVAEEYASFLAELIQEMNDAAPDFEAVIGDAEAH